MLSIDTIAQDSRHLIAAKLNDETAHFKQSNSFGNSFLRSAVRQNLSVRKTDISWCNEHLHRRDDQRVIKLPLLQIATVGGRLPNPVAGLW